MVAQCDELFAALRLGCEGVELDRAARVAKSLGVTDHRTVLVDLRAIGGSALTADVAVNSPVAVVDTEGDSS